MGYLSIPNHFLTASSGTTVEPIDVDNSDLFAPPDIDFNESDDGHNNKKSKAKSTRREVSLSSLE